MPETCCECGNRLLDRGTVVGTLDDKTIGFFADLLDESQENAYARCCYLHGQTTRKQKEVPVFEFTFKNQPLVKEGDIAVFCFWNKKDESPACYGGIGKVSKVLSLNNRRVYVKTIISNTMCL